MSMRRMSSSVFFLLSIILTLSSTVLTFTSHTAEAARNSTAQQLCKTTPDSLRWPSSSAWESLNVSVGGRLLQPPPPGAVCHPGQPTYDAGQCPTVRAGWLTYDWHSESPVSTDWNNWNNDTCLPDAVYPCSGAGYPVYVVNATSADDVQAAVLFAKTHNIRLVVKSSGHDYLGRSNAPNSLSIWTHHLTGISVHEGTTFNPTSCGVEVDGTAVTVAGGMKMWDIQETLAAANRTVVGGTGRTVSVGGYLTGGGHSLLSSRYGLAADQVLELEVVTPRGEIVTANECQNEDLFWALRGGGGSTFGIITSATMKTYPSPELVQLSFAIFATDPAPNSTAIMEMNAYLLSQFPSLMDAGLTGYTFLVPPGSASPLPDTDNTQNITTTVGGIYGALALLDTQSPQAILDLLAPPLAHINATWPGVFQAHLASPPVAYASFWDWFRDNYDTSAAGSDALVGSRLLKRETLEAAVKADPGRLSGALARYGIGGAATAYLVGGRGVREAVPRGGGDAVLPAWRRAYIHSTVAYGYAPFNESSKREAMEGMEYALRVIQNLEPASGSYVNEAYRYEQGWQHDFWGDHYDRLVEIKRDIDPDDVLWCHPCVGNERWHEVDGQLCRVPTWQSRDNVLEAVEDEVLARSLRTKYL